MSTRKLYVGLSEQDVSDLAEVRRLYNAAHGTPVKSDADLVRTLIREELAALTDAPIEALGVAEQPTA